MGAGKVYAVVKRRISRIRVGADNDNTERTTTMQVGSCVIQHRVFGARRAVALPSDEITMCTKLYRMTVTSITGVLWRGLRGLPAEQQIALRLWDDRLRESN